MAINNARFIEDTEQARDVATQLYEITEQLATSPDMNSVIDLIAIKAAELLVSHSRGFLRFDERQGVLVRASTFNVPPEFTTLTVHPSLGVTGRAFQERQPSWFED